LLLFSYNPVAATAGSAADTGEPQGDYYYVDFDTDE
jgi:hypothetical protein